MDLLVERHGRGPRVTLVHGWAMHGGLMRPLRDALPDFEVARADLPGHGRNRALSWPDDPAVLTGALLDAAGEGGWLAGWSLGGQLALAAAASRPGYLGGLVLIAASPSLVRRPHWPHGVAPELLEIMAAELTEDPEGVLNRFLALEVHGADDAAAQLRHLRKQTFRHGLPDAHALRAGLESLRRTDLTGSLADLALPVLVLGGRRDRLVDPGSIEAIANALPRGRASVIAGAAHAPFLTHAGDIADPIRRFMLGT